MMKRLILVVLAFAVCFSAADARRRTPKAGKLDGGWYVDAKYNFKLNVPEDWSVSIKDEDDPIRVVLIQKNYQIPPDYMNAEDYTEVPRLSVYVVETPMSAIAFRDSLLSKSYDSDIKDDIRKYFEILNDQSIGSGMRREPLVTKNRDMLYIDSLPAALWFGESQYIKNVTLSAAAQSGKRVNGQYAGTIVTVKNGDKMLLFHLMTEGMYHRTVWQEVQPMIESLEWER